MVQNGEVFLEGELPEGAGTATILKNVESYSRPLVVDIANMLRHPDADILLGLGNPEIRLGMMLRIARKGQGITQVELAERSGISQSTISEIESGREGRDGGRQDTVQKLAKALGYSVGLIPDLFSGHSPDIVLVTPPSGELTSVEPKGRTSTSQACWAFGLRQGNDEIERMRRVVRRGIGGGRQPHRVRPPVFCEVYNILPNNVAPFRATEPAVFFSLRDYATFSCSEGQVHKSGENWMFAGADSLVKIGNERKKPVPIFVMSADGFLAATRKEEESPHDVRMARR